MTDFVAYSSRWRIMLLILIAAIFVALGAWMSGIIGSPPTSRRYSEWLIATIGWFSLLFFGLGGMLWTKKLFDREDQLRIGYAGVRWKPWSDQTIPWSEVANVTVWNLNRQSSIILHLRNGTKYPGKGLLAVTAKANRMLTGGDIPISLTGTDRSFAEAFAAVEHFRPNGS